LINSIDEMFMRAALEQAREALHRGEVPIGAVLVKDGAIICHAHNSPITLQDPTAHAEILALRSAGQRLNNYRFLHTELYVTLEPCVMCMGALVHARVKRLIFGAADPKAGAAGSVFNLACHEKLNHAIDVTPGVLAEECGDLLQKFFKERRNSGGQ
jgi:tRNA(adenine34) deaminase